MYNILLHLGARPYPFQPVGRHAVSFIDLQQQKEIRKQYRPKNQAKNTKKRQTNKHSYNRYNRVRIANALVYDHPQHIINIAYKQQAVCQKQYTLNVMPIWQIK
jgi:hypothetical protein